MTYNFLSLIVKMILLETTLSFSTLAEAKTQSFVHQSFNSTLQLIAGISNDLQKLLRCFNDTAIVAVPKIELFPSATLLSNTLALYLKDLKALWSAK